MNKIETPVKNNPDMDNNKQILEALEKGIDIVVNSGLNHAGAYIGAGVGVLIAGPPGAVAGGVVGGIAGDLAAGAYNSYKEHHHFLGENPAIERCANKLQLYAGVSDKESLDIMNKLLSDNSHEIIELRSDLTDFISKQAQKEKEQERAQQIAALEKDVNAFISVLGQLGVITNCKELVKFTEVAKHCVTIGFAIAQIAAGAAAGSAVGPYGAIAGAIVGLVSAFMTSGPSPTQIMLEQIGILSQQLSALHKQMNENFKQTFLNQKLILETIIKGFTQIGEMIRDQSTAMRLDLDYRLGNLQNSVDFLTRLYNLAQIQHIVQELKTNINASRTYLTLESPTVGDANNAMNSIFPMLYDWLSRRSKDPLLTGYTVALAQPTNANFRTVFTPPDNTDFQLHLNSWLSYLLDYAEDKRKSYAADKPDANYSAYSKKPTDIPNPAIQIQAINHLVNLGIRLPKVRNELDQVGNAIMEQESILKLFADLATDSLLWNALLADYQKNLNDIKTTILNFAKATSTKELERLNDLYKSDKVKALDLLKKPDELISIFNTGTITKLLDIVFNGEKITNTQPIIAALNSRSLMPSSYLCAEYLQLLTVSHTLESREDYNPINPIQYATFIRRRINIQ